MLWLYHCTAFCHRAVQQSARVMYVLPVLYSYRACTIAQSARVMYVVPVLYSCRAVAVPLHRVLYSRRATVSTGNVRFTRFVLVPCCGCTIAPFVGNVPFTRFCTHGVLWLYHCTAFCTRAAQQSARAMYVLPVLYSCRFVVVQLRSQPR